jgi:hypothetical protein
MILKEIFYKNAFIHEDGSILPIKWRDDCLIVNWKTYRGKKVNGVSASEIDNLRLSSFLNYLDKNKKFNMFADKLNIKKFNNKHISLNNVDNESIKFSYQGIHSMSAERSEIIDYTQVIEDQLFDFDSFVKKRKLVKESTERSYFKLHLNIKEFLYSSSIDLSLKNSSNIQITFNNSLEKVSNKLYYYNVLKYLKQDEQITKKFYKNNKRQLELSIADFILSTYLTNLYKCDIILKLKNDIILLKNYSVLDSCANKSIERCSVNSKEVEATDYLLPVTF